MKHLAIIAALLASVSFAYAQDDIKPAEKPADAPVATPAPIPNPPAKFYLELDQADLNALSMAINELPKRIADPLVLKLNSQITNQAVQAKVAAEYTTSMEKGDKVKRHK